MTRHPTVPLFDDVMGVPVPTMQTGAEDQRDALAARQAEIRADLTDLSRRAFVANQVGGPDLFNVPAQARAMLEADPSLFTPDTAGLLELERISGYRTDAHRACRAITEEVGA